MPCARFERPACAPGRTLKVMCSAALPRRRWALAGTARGCVLLFLDSTTFCTASAKSPGLNCCAETNGGGGTSSGATAHAADQPFGRAMCVVCNCCERLYAALIYNVHLQAIRPEA